MGEKEKKIIESAIDVINRYGVKRTTMNDIADAAKISRQTLYSSYSNKNELLRAIICYKTDNCLSDIKACVCEDDCLGNKIDILFEHLALKHRETLDASPDAADIIIGFNEAAKDELAVAGTRVRKEIEVLLEPYKKNIENNGTSVAALAAYIQQSLFSLKKDSSCKMQLLEYLAVLKISILRLAGDSHG